MRSPRLPCRIGSDQFERAASVRAKLETFFYVQYERRPDITVLWENSFPWQSIHSSRIGTLRLRRQGARTGSHRAHGFLLIAGPGIPAGRVLSGHSIYDIVPTVLPHGGGPEPPGP